MEKIEKYMKQALKNKVKITKAAIIAILITGGITVPKIARADTPNEKAGTVNENHYQYYITNENEKHGLELGDNSQARGTGIGVMLGEVHDGNVDTPSHVKEQLIKSEKERQLMRKALISQQNKAKQQENQIKDLYRIIGELQNQLKNNEKTKESIEKH